MPFPWPLRVADAGPEATKQAAHAPGDLPDHRNPTHRQKGHPMTDTTVTERETRRADELKPGDWLARGEVHDECPAEVLAVLPYQTTTDGPSVTVVYRNQDGKPENWDLGDHATLSLATEAELNAAREVARRAQRIADLRTFVDFLHRNPWAPLPYLHMQADMHRSEIGGDVDDDGLAELHRIADTLGEKVDEHLDDRTSTGRQFGSVEYKVIAWHKAGRPLVISDETIEAAGRMGSWNEREQKWDDPSPDPLGLNHSREADDPTPVSPARVPAHIGAVTDGGLVDETPEESVTRYFSFGYGHTDPATGESLRDKYVTVIAATAEGCREAMLASRFGRQWAFEYIPGLPKTDEWIPRWTEHERIDAMPCEAYTPTGPCVLPKGHGVAELCSPQPLSDVS
jgi:hypothetical protein